MTALSGSPYLSSGTAFLIGEAVFFCFSKDQRCRQQGCFRKFRFHTYGSFLYLLESILCTGGSDEVL